VGVVCQGSVTQVPVFYYDVTQSMPVGNIEFEPIADFKCLRLDPSNSEDCIKSQFTIPGYEGVDPEKPGDPTNKLYYNLCGEVALGAIIQNVLGKDAPSVAKIMEAFTSALSDETIKQGTKLEHLKTIAEKLGVTGDIGSTPTTNEDYL
jgi:hypothetical protein